jgi:hypothetical protein
VSYGYFVHLERQERRFERIGRSDWWSAALKFAADNFDDYPEYRVVRVLHRFGWPEHPVTFPELYAALKRDVPAGERRAWLADVDAGRPGDWDVRLELARKEIDRAA